MKDLRILGVSQGQGTLLFPLRRYVIANIEPRARFHTPGNEQWKSNFGDIPFVRSFKKLPNQIKKSDIDVIISSPDCGHSSALSYSRKKTLGNPRVNTSMNLFVESVKTLRPKIFLMENLPKLLTQISLEDWKETFPKYDLLVHCHPVSIFGNSQVNRKRMMIIGVKKNNSSILLKHFRKVYAVNEPKVTRELLKVSESYTQEDIILPEDKNVVLYDYRDPANKEKKKKWLSQKEVKKLWTKDFKDMGRWPINSAKMKNLPGVYRNLPEKYPNTLVPSPRQFRPDGKPLTINNFKAIQGLPDKFNIYREPENTYYWFAKACATIAKGPVYEMGIWFKRCLKKAWKDYQY